MAKQDAQKEFEKNAKKWVMDSCSWVKDVHFHPNTWDMGFTWQEKLEGGVTKEKHDLVYHEGIS